MRLLFLFFFIFVNPVFAQDIMLPSDPSNIDQLNAHSSEKEYRDLDDKEPYKSIPYEYIQEAQNVYKTCTSDIHFYPYYDCRCLSVQYLDVRIESGAERNKDSIFLSLQGQCKDGTYAAGLQYQNCMRNGTILFPRGKTPQEYCQCVANQAAKLYEASSAKPNTASYTSLISRAHLKCKS